MRGRGDDNYGMAAVYFLCVIGANEGVMAMKELWWRIFYRKGRDADRE